jgi:tetratricopeptide (TPR) repeat protein
VVDELRTKISAHFECEVPAEWRNIGFVLELNAAAPEVLEKDAKAAQAIAQFAIAVLAAISADAYPRTILRTAEATAWKELANAHRYQSDYAAALRALDAGDRCLADSLTSAYDEAVLHFARALIYCDQGRFDEADEVLAASLRVFAEHQDQRRSGQCLLLQGMSQHRRGLFRDACSSYEAAISKLRRTDDLASLASAFNNLGHARSDLGEHAAGVTALHNALAIFTDLAMTGEGVRTRGVLGRVLLSQGHFGQARAMFVETRAAFLRLGMPEEAGIIGLLLVEALVALHAIPQAQMALEDVIDEFQRANLGERAATALAYLRDMVDTAHGRQAARHVREYVKRLRDEPLQLFVPLPPD